MRKNGPIRMCVTCRVRELQKELIRLQTKIILLFLIVVRVEVSICVVLVVVMIPK